MLFGIGICEWKEDWKDFSYDFVGDTSKWKLLWDKIAQGFLGTWDFFPVMRPFFLNVDELVE